MRITQWKIINVDPASKIDASAAALPVTVTSRFRPLRSADFARLFGLLIGRRGRLFLGLTDRREPLRGIGLGDFILRC